AKYVASREKDRTFTRELAARRLVQKDRLFTLLDQTAIAAEARERIRAAISSDFAQPGIAGASQET
ncbi:MAG: hypothetical protein ACREUG_01460, partial [Steroidobacteraceae bacterium]